ncbi:MAG TPA: hypothetical protein VKT82_19210 [Ktedonobacterales bacterium]|nr:hypothetical protein [Ktedonobacterales bacterium]
MEPKSYNNERKFRYPRSPIIFEIACVVCVLGVALYFIVGASAHGGAPQASTTSNTSLVNTTSPSPTPTRTPAATSTIPPWNGAAVQILSVTPDNSTAKITFKPVAGAKDYRVFDISEPKVVKYAGMAHLTGGPFLMNPDGTLVVPFQQGGNGPSTLDIPFPQIEWNLLEDGKPHTLVVQAVNELGPIPPGNLYNDNNAPLTARSQSYSTLGMNEGITPDGHDSINGQGPSTDNPKVIAQSAPFVVQANTNYRAIPSTSSDTQTFFDTFDDSEASAFKRTAYNAEADKATYTLNAGTDKAWTIQYQEADVQDSYPFINAGHFMDVLFDGGTPGTSIPLHDEHGLMAMSPDQTADFSGGKVLHITMEVDLHESGRRWMGIELAPANDPLTGFDAFTGAINQSDKGLFFDYLPGTCDLELYTGQSAGAGSSPNDTHIWGGIGNSVKWCDLSNFYWGGKGVSLDNRGKLDLFVSQTHAALFINGQLAIETDIPGGLPFSQAKVYFTHYVYHTTNDHGELQQYSPYETFWINYYSWSDERHWDNMGFEVFPSAAASNSSAWQTLVTMPKAISPQFVSPGTGSNGNASVRNPSGSPIIADVPSSTIG